MPLTHPQRPVDWFTSRIANSITLALLVVSVSVNVVQGQKLRASGAPAASGPAINSIVQPFAAVGLDGRPAEIDFSGRPTILYYFSAKCGWCERNWPNVKALIARTDGQYRFIGLSAGSDISTYLTERRLSFEVYSGVGAEAVRALALGGTPKTIVVSGEGRVQYVWAGAYGPAQTPAVERALGVALPGLTPPGGEK